MSLIQRFMTGTYKVTRSKRGQYVKGRYVAGPTEDLAVNGSLQPTNARELKLAEEGSRLRQYFKFYSDKRIVLINTTSLADSDHITINGEKYRAMSREQWEGVDLEYFMTIVWREPEQDTDGAGGC